MKGTDEEGVKEMKTRGDYQNSSREKITRIEGGKMMRNDGERRREERR